MEGPRLLRSRCGAVASRYRAGPARARRRRAAEDGMATPPRKGVASPELGGRCDSMEVLERAVQDPRYHQLLSIVKGFRNGLMYGVKIRFPHALVMTFLFHEGSLKEKLLFIVQATYQHARNLALFTALYKVLTLTLQRLRGCDHPLHNFAAGFVGGYLVFGENNKINMQINLYLLSRISLALVKLASERGYLPKPSFSVFPWFAALMWGLVLWLYEHHKPLLQPSLQNSMTYLYHDSGLWTGLRDMLLYNSAQLW